MENFIESLLIEKSVTNKEVQESLKLKYEIKFSYYDVKNACFKIKSKLFGKANEDARTLIKLLEELKENKLIFFDKLIGDNQNLRAFLFVTNGMASLYKEYKDIIILDTTLGLNRFNMPVLTIASIDNFGRTVILGFACMENETAEIKEWVLSKYLDYVKTPPDAYISDSCPALLKALRIVIPTAKPFLCGWHVQLNFKKHFAGFKKTLKKKSKLIKILVINFLLELELDFYDRIIHLPFNPSKNKFKEICKEIKDSDIIATETKEYFENLCESQEKWSLAFRKEESIIGVQTTSRIESLHNLIKNYIRSKCSLTELVIRLICFAKVKNSQNVEEEKISNDVFNLLSKNLILANIKEKYSNYAYQKCLISFAQSLSLKITKREAFMKSQQ